MIAKQWFSAANRIQGDVLLAHQGVLFPGELPEFGRSTLEEGKSTMSHAAGAKTFPAQFMLAAAMNPSPCGFECN